MIDLHCHLLPGVDDGPKTMGQAFELARLLVKEGTTHVICTPHCHRTLQLMRDDIAPRVEQLSAALQREGIPLSIFSGSEVQLWNVDWVRERYESGELALLSPDRKFMLMEFAWNDRLFPEDIGGFLRWLISRGTQPIMAHPERHDFLRERPDRIEAIAQSGAWMQLTVGSLFGDFGYEAQESATELLEHPEYPLILASDSHGSWRYSGVEEGLQLVSKQFGSERAVEMRRRLQSVEDHLVSEAARR